MRIKVKTPNQHELTSMWIFFVGISAVLLGGAILLLISSGGQLTDAVQGVRELLNEAKQDSSDAYLGLLTLLAAVILGPFASGAALFYYSRKGKKENTFSALNFDDSGLTLESTDPAKSVFTPYAELSCHMEVAIAVRRGSKGVSYRRIENVTLIFYTPQGPQTVTQTGSMNFIRQILDVAGRFSSFAADVHSRNSLFDKNELDLVRHVKEQIHHYRTYGYMLRFSDSQRKTVRMTGYFLLGIGVLFLLGLLGLFGELWSAALHKHDRFAWVLALLLSAVWAGISIMGARMWYLAHQDDKLARQLTKK